MNRKFILYFGKDLTLEKLDSFVGRELGFVSSGQDYIPISGILLKSIIYSHEYFKIHYLKSTGESTWFYLSRYENDTNELKIFD